MVSPMLPASLNTGMMIDSAGMRSITCSLPRHFPSRPDVLNPFPVDSKIGMPEPGCRSDMDDLGAFIEPELHVIDEPENCACELCVNIAVRISDDTGPLHTENDLLDFGMRLGDGPRERERLDS